MAQDTSDYRSELAKQEAASSQASREAARAQKRAEHAAQRTAALRRVVEAEEVVRAHEEAAAERARLWEAAQDARREEERVSKHIDELQREAKQAEKERRQWQQAAATYNEEYQESRRKWSDAEGARTKLAAAKQQLAALTQDATPSQPSPSRPVASPSAKPARIPPVEPPPPYEAQSARQSPVRGSGISIAGRAKAASSPVRTSTGIPVASSSTAAPRSSRGATWDHRIFLGDESIYELRDRSQGQGRLSSSSGLRHEASSSSASLLQRIGAVAKSSPTSSRTARAPATYNSAPAVRDEEEERGNISRNRVIPASELAAKRRRSEEAEQAAKKARLSGKVKVEEEDPF